MTQEPQTDPGPPQPPRVPTTGEVVRRLGPAGPLAAISAVLPAVCGIVLLYNASTAGAWLRQQGAAVYAGLFALLAGFSLLPTYASAIVGGWAFGLRTGFGASLLGFLGGALIGYEIALRASGDRVQTLVAEQPKWKAVIDSLVHGSAGRTLAIVTLVRIPPNSPFAITNLVMASTKVGRIPFLVGTLVGMAPRTFLAVSIGAGLGEVLSKDAIDDARRHYIFWGIGAAVAVVLIIGQLGKKALERVSSPEA
jgi:uncharacterized membrane protein YdjX (TVP38/TMEM64 family)